MQLVSAEKKVTRTEQQLVGGSDSGLLTHDLADHQLPTRCCLSCSKDSSLLRMCSTERFIGPAACQRQSDGIEKKHVSLLTFHKGYGQCRCDKSQHDTNNKKNCRGNTMPSKSFRVYRHIGIQNLEKITGILGRSQWPRGVRNRSVTARLLRL